MGQSAAAVSRRSVVARPSLHTVRRSAPRSSARSSARRDQHVRELFNLVCVAMIALTIFALARVALAATAAATAIEAGRINREIKAERLVGDLLECDKSSLTVPSRIECIAGESLQMAEAPQVSYLRLPAQSADSGQDDAAEAASGVVPATSQDVVVASAASSESGRLSGMLASVMEMAAGEAEVLLVGDAALASTR